jgi:hypothetical protein
MNRLATDTDHDRLITKNANCQDNGIIVKEFEKKGNLRFVFLFRC